MSDASSIDLPGIRFVVDGRGRRTAVVIELDRHGELWEDMFDRLRSDERRTEPRESLASVAKKLKKRAARTSRA